MEISSKLCIVFYIGHKMTSLGVLLKITLILWRAQFKCFYLNLLEYYVSHKINELINQINVSDSI